MEKIIEGFPNYKITDEGQVLTCYVNKHNIDPAVWRVLTPVLDRSCGYYLVTLCHEGVRKNKRIHRLMMEAFVPNPENKAHVNHIDGNKLNNTMSNLEWATCKENSIHASKLGLYEPALEKTRVAIEQYSADGSDFIQEHVSLHEAGRTTGVAWQNISKVVRGLRPRAGGFHWKYKNV